MPATEAKAKAERSAVRRGLREIHRRCGEHRIAPERTGRKGVEDARDLHLEEAELEGFTPGHHRAALGGQALRLGHVAGRLRAEDLGAALECQGSGVDGVIEMTVA